MKFVYTFSLIFIFVSAYAFAETKKSPFQTEYTILEGADKVLDTQDKDLTIETGRTAFKPKTSISSGVTLTVDGNLLTSDVISGAGTLAGSGTVARVDKQAVFDESVTFNNDVSIVGTLFGGSPLDIGSEVNLNSDLNVTGTTNLTQDLNITNGGLNITGTDKDITVSDGQITLNGSDKGITVNSGDLIVQGQNIRVDYRVGLISNGASLPDIEVGSSGLLYTGTIHAFCMQTGDFNDQTYRMYHTSGRGNTALFTVIDEHLRVSGCSFTVTRPIDRFIRLTNNSGVDCNCGISYFGLTI